MREVQNESPILNWCQEYKIYIIHWISILLPGIYSIKYVHICTKIFMTLFILIRNLKISKCALIRNIYINYGIPIQNNLQLFKRRRSSCMMWKDVCDAKLSANKGKTKGYIVYCLWVGKLIYKWVYMHTNWWISTNIWKGIC